MPKTLTEKRDELVDMGVSPEQLDRIQQLNALNADKANKKGIERKEATDEAEEAAPVEAVETQAHAAPETAGLTVEQLAATISEHVEAVVAPLMTKINALEQQVKELSHNAEVKEVEDNLPPTLSLAAQLHSIRKQRAIGNPAAQVKEADVRGPEQVADDYSNMTLGRLITGHR